jgi:hypothetical protein
VFLADWNVFEKEHEHLRERQRLLARRQAFLKTYENTIREVRGWRYQATAAQDARRAFVAALPDLAAVLKQQAQRNNPALTMTVKIDRRALEAAREAQVAADANPMSGKNLSIRFRGWRSSIRSFRVI